jgi:hypothetical protein
MSLYSLFETNEDTELDGFELILFDNEVEIKFTLARAGGSNKRFATRMQALLRPYERSIKAGTMSDDKAEDIMCQTIAETVILSWSNVNDRDGKALPFSVPAAKQLLLDLPELRTVILEEAQKAVNFIAEEVEQNSKN